MWPISIHSSSLPGERTALAYRGVPTDSRWEQAAVLPTGFMRRHSHHFIASALPFLALLLGWLLLISICNRFRAKAANPGSLGRRLAGGEEDEDSLSDPELELLCAAALEWTPTEPPPGEQRTSPAMVSAYFQLLDETSAELEVSEAAVRQPTQTRGRDDDDSVEEQSSPSSKLRRTELGPRPVAPPSAPSAAPPTPSTSFASSPGAAMLQSWQPQPSTTLAELLSVSGAGRPTSTTKPAPLAAQAPSGAPQRQAQGPAILAGVSSMAWQPNVVLGPQIQGHSTYLMGDLHRLLVTPALDVEGINKLMHLTERLANYIWHAFSAGESNPPPKRFVISAGLRFLAFTLLYAAVEKVGRDLPGWWLPMANEVLEGFTDFAPRLPGMALNPNRELAHSLAAALAFYKTGNAPPSEEVLRLKRLLLTAQGAPAHFRSSKWDFLRKEL